MQRDPCFYDLMTLLNFFTCNLQCKGWAVMDGKLCGNGILESNDIEQALTIVV